jgi:hypothetical protein
MVRLLSMTMVICLGSAAAAQPKFEYGKKEDVKAVEWKASAQAGLILTTGNSRSVAFSASATASRKAGNNKLSLEAGAAYARSDVLIAVDADMSGTIGPSEITRDDAETTKNWNLKLRYDRFFSERDSAYVAARIGADELAGKELVGGGQIGYSRLVYKTETRELAAELGYDFSYESYVADVDALAIHSARVFAGYTAKASEVTGYQVSVEALFNLNAEDTPTGEIGAFGDTRVTAKASFNTKLATRIDLRLGATLKWDQAPAPRAPFAIPYDASFVPLADETDLTTEAVIIVNFL